MLEQYWAVLQEMDTKSSGRLVSAKSEPDGSQDAGHHQSASASSAGYNFREIWKYCLGQEVKRHLEAERAPMGKIGAALKAAEKCLRTHRREQDEELAYQKFWWRSRIDSSGSSEGMAAEIAGRRSWLLQAGDEETGPDAVVEVTLHSMSALLPQSSASRHL